MSLGDYMRISAGYRYKEFTESHRYRNILGALTQKDPRKIFPLPGDYSHLEKVDKEANLELLKKHGLLDIMLGKKGDC